MGRYVRIYNGAIHEYDTDHSSGVDGRIRNARDLSYPRSSRSAAYGVGDFLFPATMDKSMAGLSIREFRDAIDSEHTIGSFVMGLLDLDKVTIAYRIESISGRGDSARVTMRPMLKISNTEALELNTRGGVNGAQVFGGHGFNQHFIQNHYAQSATIWLPIGRFVLQIVTLPFGGALRSVASRVMAPLARRFGRNMLVRFIRDRAQSVSAFVARHGLAKIASFLLDVSKDVAIAVCTQVRNNQLRTDAHTASVAVNVDAIVRNAIRDSVAKNLSDLFLDGIKSAVPGAPEAGAEDFLPEDLKSKLNSIITRNLLIPAIITPITTAIRSALRTVDASRSQREYERQFRQAVDTSLTNAFSNGSHISGVLMDTVRQVGASPNLLF